MLGSSWGSVEMLEYAKSQGMYTIVADRDNLQRSIAKQHADEAWLISTNELDILEKKCKEEGVTAVVGITSDFNVDNAICLNERLGLPTYCSSATWHYSVDKADFKKVCQMCGAPIPTDYYVSDALSNEEILKVEFPVMVKPVDLAGNRGISYCYNKEDLVNGYKLARSLSKNRKIVVERMLHGEEWWSAYAMADGDIRLLALTSMLAQPGEPKNCYSITTTVSNHVEQFIKEVNPKIEAVLRAIACKEGYAWVQLMLDEDGNFYILEMGYRFDGSMMFLPFKEVCGYDAIKGHVDYARGLNTKSLLPKSQEHAFTKCGTGYMLWTNKGGTIRDIQGIDRVRKIPGVHVHVAGMVGDEIEPYHTIGCITFANKNIDGMIEMIETINNAVKIIIDKGEDVFVRYTDYDYLRKIYKEGLEGK